MDDLSAAITELRQRHYPPPMPARLPSAAEVARAELTLGVQFPTEYRRFLLEASDVEVGTLEPAMVIPDAGHRDLVAMARRGWEWGVPRRWLPICEDNANYYCLDGDIVRYWSHDGVVDESWPSLATWISQVWLQSGS
jgi:SMI1-KNR4 cell-wall